MNKEDYDREVIHLLAKLVGGLLGIILALSAIGVGLAMANWLYVLLSP